MSERTTEDIEYQKQLYDMYKISSQQFDKNILIISSGALGLSMTFIKDLINLNQIKYFGVLGFSWVLFATIILISLTSHYLSMRGIKHMIENDLPNKGIDKWLSRLNISMLIGLPIAIILLIVFVLNNI